MAGRDYDHSDFCQLCWDGGQLLCCDFCPVATHAECYEPGQTFAAMSASRAKFQCRHHWCNVCGRKAQAAGGMLFRCECCPFAFCEDHLPPAAVVTKQCLRFQAMGQEAPSTACFITCGDDCARFKDNNFGGLFNPENPAAGPLHLPGNAEQQQPKAATLPVWCKAGDQALTVSFPKGRKKQLSAANFTELKSWLEKAGFDGISFGGSFRRLRELTASRLSDAENAAAMEAMTDLVREGLVRC